MLDENVVAQLARRGVVTETFRRLEPNKKRRIYRAAVRLFGKYGYDGLTVDEICLEAGMSKGSFFQYFPSKSHLLEFTVLIFDDYLGKWVEEIRRQETTVLVKDRLKYVFHAIVVNSKLHPNEETFYLFVTRAVRHAAVKVEGVDLTRHFRDYLDEIISRGEQTGEIRGDFEISLTGYLVSVVIESIVTQYFADRQVPRRQLGEYLISFLFDGIKA